MAKDFIGYEALTDRALRGVVKEALKRVQKQGLVGSHHFYLTFKTHDPGVEIPDFLKERYPDEMTIVLQNQFSGLHVTEDGFEVTLGFQKLPATLTVPFAALTGFVDPSVQFGLQFKNATAAQNPNVVPKEPAKTTALPASPPPPQRQPDLSAKAADADPGTSQIVSLDKFRKK
ncbi:MAG TPA: ClpXP protease specificity-enhancing factor SspB [Micropepsaceae bacterium]|nr:ClpXP protease specificity-enhancing factor SspB [Micropepsaceae bacterium]